MERQRFLFAGSIVLIIVGLIKSFRYETILGTHGSGYAIHFEVSSVLLFGLMGFGLYLADRRRLGGQEGNT